MAIDGKPYTHNYLDHSGLLQGADIAFDMSDKPNVKRGTAGKDVPYSFSMSSDR